MRRERRGFAFGLAAAAAFSLLVHAQVRAGEAWEGGGPPLLRLLEEHAATLKLEPAELAQIRGLILSAKTRGRVLRQRRVAERLVLRNLLSLGAPDPEAVRRQVEVLGQIETQLLKERVNVLMELRSRLSAEQLAELGLRADGQGLLDRPERNPCGGPGGT
jgi:Spy/CpxP family protein refolding chaperone